MVTGATRIALHSLELTLSALLRHPSFTWTNDEIHERLEELYTYSTTLTDAHNSPDWVPAFAEFNANLDALAALYPSFDVFNNPQARAELGYLFFLAIANGKQVALAFYASCATVG